MESHACEIAIDQLMSRFVRLHKLFRQDSIFFPNFSPTCSNNCVAVFNQFYEFLEDGAPGENNPEKWKGDEYDELFNVYNDWAISLADYHWILPSGKKLQIIHIPHDINEDDSSIVGKIVVDNIRQSKLAEIDIEKLNDIKNTRDQLELSGEFSGTKLYIVPDDCACCT